MWLRALLLVCVTLSLVKSHGIYRAVNPRLIPWWFARFPNSRILLNRHIFNNIYRRLILRDPYWHRRVHSHRHRIYHPIHLHHRHVHPAILNTRSVGVYDRHVAGGVPGIYDEAVSLPVFSSAAGRLDSSSVASVSDVPVQLPAPEPAVVQAPLPRPAVTTSTAAIDDKHLIGKSETFVRYYSPTIDRYNTPWKKVESSYKDYGHINVPGVYDRQVLSTGPTIDYGPGSFRGSSGFFDYGLDDGFVGGGVDSGFLGGGVDGGFVGGGVDGGFVGGGVTGGGFVSGGVVDGFVGGGVDSGFVSGGGGLLAAGGSVDGGYSGGLSAFGANYPSDSYRRTRDIF